MNQTPNYALNQWEASDRIQRADFNADNAKIDAAIKAVEGEIPRVITGTYTGNGSTESPRHIDLPGRPKAVLIRTEPPSISHYFKAIVITDICTFRFRTSSEVDTVIPDDGYELEDDGFAVPGNSDQNCRNVLQHYLAVI